MRFHVSRLRGLVTTAVLCAWLGTAAAEERLPTVDECFDDFFQDLAASQRRFPKDTLNRDRLDQASQQVFNTVVVKAWIPPESHDQHFQNLIERLVVAGRLSIETRTQARQMLISAATQMFAQALPRSTDAFEVRSFEECYDDLAAHLRKARVLFFNPDRVDLRSAAATASQSVFQLLFTSATPSTGIDYTSWYATTIRKIDVELPPATDEERLKAPKVAEQKDRNSSNNQMLKDACNQILQKSLAGRSGGS